MRRTACLFAAALACHGSGPPASSFGTLPATAGPADDSGTTETTGTTGHVPEDSTAAPASATAGTTLVLDVGSPDAGVHAPGCRGKIDFLFVIERFGNMEVIQDKLVAALPKFVATIESRFAGFDYQIMVVDTEPDWGNYDCNLDCSPQGCTVPDYPCDLMDTLTECDWTIGAGTVFNAGHGTLNKPCPIAGGRRYLVKGQPDLAGTFECIARVGLNGGTQVGEALTSAVTLARPGECNAGFIRDDALLFVSMIHYTVDWQSTGTPEDWAEAVLDAKHGDPNAVVMFDLGPLSGLGWTDLDSCAASFDNSELCEMLQYFPYRLLKDHAIPDYGIAFDEAAALVDTACASFIPR